MEAGSADVKGLVASGRTLVEGAERLVCALYGIGEEVIAYAVARAASCNKD